MNLLLLRIINIKNKHVFFLLKFILIVLNYKYNEIIKYINQSHE